MKNMRVFLSENFQVFLGEIFYIHVFEKACFRNGTEQNSTPTDCHII